MGTRSTQEVEVPNTDEDWQALNGQVVADLLNRRRELAEVHGFAKLAKTRYETKHANTRRALAMHSVGLTDEAKKVLTLPV